MPPPSRHLPGGDLSNIRNKIKRNEVFARLQGEKKAATRVRRDKRKREEEELGAAAPPKQVPRTIEGTRTYDDTVVAADDEEVLGDEAEDEFASIFSGAVAPKLMVTTQRYPSAKVFPLISELLAAFPRAFYYRRQHFALSKISEWAAAKGFTHLLVLVESSAKVAHTMIICKLPGGPTGAFKLSSAQLTRDIAGHGARTSHAPELILNNFTARLGRRVGRLLGSLFAHKPEFTGRQVVTFHNQRDYIFFRQHRYVFAHDGSGATLQELGPRFTLKPRWLLAGGMDTREGEYEFINSKQSDIGLTRRTFML